MAEKGSESSKEERGIERTAPEERRMARPERRMGPTQSPFGLARRMFEEMDRLVSSLGLGELVRPSMLPDLGQQAWAPRIEIEERQGELVVRADLPGLGQDDIELEIADGALILAGERKAQLEDRAGGVYRSERLYGSFRRVIPLPDNVDLESVDARIDNGVLEVVFKTEEQRQERRSIPVRGSEKPAEPKSDAEEVH